MKKVFFALFLVSSATFAQHRAQNQPPVTVQRSFERENAGSNNATWMKTSNQWHANYRDNNNHNVDAYYDRNGRRVDTHREVDRREVPQNVDSRLNSMYHANGNYKAIKIERPNSQPLFQIQIQSGSSRNRTIYMDEQGRTRSYNDRHR